MARAVELARGGAIEAGGQLGEPAAIGKRKPQTIKVPNWPSSTHTVAAIFSDSPQD